MKNLEKEYKEQISLETPDLWSRIEAGVDAYEASKTEAAPVSKEGASQDKIVKFDSKRLINTIGKISVAAVLILAVAATYNVARHSRRDYGAATEATIINDYQNAAEATESYSPAEDIASKDDSAIGAGSDYEETIVNESPSIIAEPEAENSYSKDTLPTLSPSSSEATTDAEVSSEKTADIRSVNKTAKQLGLSWDQTLMLYTKLSEIGLTDVSELTAVEGGAKGSEILGADYENTSLSVVSFTAGDRKAPFLLYYRTENGIEIMAVKNAETGEFIYTNTTE